MPGIRGSGGFGGRSSFSGRGSTRYSSGRSSSRGYGRSYFFFGGGSCGGAICCIVLVGIIVLSYFLFYNPQTSYIENNDYAVISPDYPTQNTQYLYNDVFSQNYDQFGKLQTGTEPGFGTFYTLLKYDISQLSGSEPISLGLTYWISVMEVAQSYSFRLIITQISTDWDWDTMTYNDLDDLTVVGQVANRSFTVSSSQTEYAVVPPVFIGINCSFVDTDTEIAFLVNCTLDEHIIGLGWWEGGMSDDIWLDIVPLFYVADPVSTLTVSAFQPSIQLGSISNPWKVLVTMIAGISAAVLGLGIYSHRRTKCNELEHFAKNGSDEAQAEFDRQCSK